MQINVDGAISGRIHLGCLFWTHQESKQQQVDDDYWIFEQLESRTSKSMHDNLGLTCYLGPVKRTFGLSKI